MTKYKASKNLDLETTVQYLSKTRSLQSNSADNLFLDLGVRQKIIKGKGVRKPKHKRPFCLETYGKEQTFKMIFQPTIIMREVDLSFLDLAMDLEKEKQWSSLAKSVFS